ncbi:MAG: hypothetical protein INR71_07735 [Terriglobus roseus]|nr:hypothetical protein [Terriglobus roseus]
MVINGATTTFSSDIGPITSAPVLTIDGHTYTAQPGGGTTYIIDGQTLTPGGVVTVSGEVISLSPGATVVVVDGKTITLFPATGAATATRTTTRLISASTSALGAAATGGSDGGDGTDPSLQGAAFRLGAGEELKAIAGMAVAICAGVMGLWCM